MPPTHSESNLYGSAKLYETTDKDITEIYNSSGGLAMPLGHNDNNRGLGLTFDLGENGHKGHALTIGRTRGGKGVSSIIPALLTYKGSMVVIDPKGENAWITAEHRRQMGQRVVILDPWNEVNRRYGVKVGVLEQITKFNPLSALDPNDPDFADDITAIADAFILQTGNDPHWPDSARELTGGLIAGEVQRNPGTGSMREVRKLLRASLSVLKAAVDRTIQEFPESVAAGKLAAVVETDVDGKPLSSREMGAIRSTARTQTGFLDSERLLESMETDDPPFNLADLATDKVTLYLVLPVDKLKSHGRWLRMILTLAIRAISKQAKQPETPALFLLDELGTISPGSGLSMIEQSYGLMAGLGIRIWAFLQDLPQLQRDYPQSWETFISNSSIIQLLNVGDSTTARYFSDYLGTGTVEVNKGFSKHVRPTAKTGSFSDGFSKAGQQMIDSMARAEGNHVDVRGNHFEKETWEPDLAFHSRAVLLPQEVRDSSKDHSIIICPGEYNLRLKRFKYYSDPVFGKWARPDPNKPAPKIDLPPAPPPPPPPTAGDRIAGAIGNIGGFMKKKVAEKIGGQQ